MSDRESYVANLRTLRRCYLGKFACPRCGSTDTATDVIATSERWITFVCFACLRHFRKSSRTVSALSRTLHALKIEVQP